MIFADYSNGEVVEALVEALTEDEFTNVDSNEFAIAVRDGYLSTMAERVLAILSEQYGDYGDFETTEDAHDLCAGLKTEMGESI